MGRRLPRRTSFVSAVCILVFTHCTRGGNKPEGSQASAGAEVRAGDPQAADHTHEIWTLSRLAVGSKLLGNLGSVRRSITHRVPDAQELFNQGLALTYGFNHDEAARSYARAAEIDPTCAMCFWGAAYTLGPNYNMPLLPDRAQAAWEAIVAAQKVAPQAAPVEQALIAALAKRYAGPTWVAPEEMAAYNRAYADAMRQVAQEYPEDWDVQTLYAEALMNLNPWKLWTADGQPTEHTEEIVRVLERVLARVPDHAGANHFYIHAVEASKTPQRAVPAAERLGSLVPGAGHLVHMPAHIFQRVGRYGDAAEANRRAIEADRKYLEQVTPPGYYPFYLGHNFGFLAYAAAMQGRSAEALEASRESARAMPKDVVCGMPGMDFFLSEPLLVMVRFGRWEDIAKEPMPDAKYPTLVALWHHAQGMAKAARGQRAEAEEHAAQIRQISAALSPELTAGLNAAKDVLALAAKVVEARAAEAAKEPVALSLWQEAVALEDQLSYNEPADWFYPTRHYWGAALLDAGKAQEAEAVYREDLTRHPNNGWSLFGLSQALKAQKKSKAAKEAETAYREAWKEADVELTRSAF